MTTTRRIVCGLALVVMTPLAASADHMGVGRARDVLRVAMQDQGYLSFRHAAPKYNGDERTGWTDIRHPVLDGTTDGTRGYDWSDFQVRVQTHNVKAPGGDTTVDAARRRSDFNVANAVYAQAGITVRHDGNANTNGNDIVTDATGNEEPSLSRLFGTDRGAAVNQYYVDDIPGARGYALPPTYAARGGYANGGSNTNPPPPGGFPTFNNGFAVADDAGTSTFAHELGHFLLDDHRFAPSPEFHSAAADDLMAERPNHPGLAPKDAPNFGLRAPGQQVGNIGTHSHLKENVTRLGEANAISQMTAMHRSPSVSHVDNGFTHGDRADFDWVEDNIPLEFAGGGADNHAGFDFLLWEIANIAKSSHPGHDHDDWGELQLNRFAGPGFRSIDVVSQVARYVDMDVDASGNWSAFHSALDYLPPQFSIDGTTWQAGKLSTIFAKGWTEKSTAEDWIARWAAPFASKFVRIQAAVGPRHDRNTQIDAIIASAQQVPEPALVACLTIGLVGLAMKRRRG